MENVMTTQTLLTTRTTGAVLTIGIVALTAATAYIHLTLGGLLFLLNGLGYAGFIVLILLAATAPHPLIARFDWFPRVALIGYTATTIGGYLVIGPYFSLGWLTKGIEVALVALVVVDVFRVYGSPERMVRRAMASVLGDWNPLGVRRAADVPHLEAPRVAANAREGA
jgi:hypothetical protein